MVQYTPASDKFVHKVSVDFKRRAVNEQIHVVQYDNSLPIIAVSLFSDYMPYSIPANAEGNIRIKKKDGTYVYNPALGCNSDGTVLYFEVTHQITTFPGVLEPIIEIRIGTMVAASGTIKVEVDKNPIQSGDIESTNEYKTIQGYVEVVKENARNAKDTDISNLINQLAGYKITTKMEDSDGNYVTDANGDYIETVVLLANPDDLLSILERVVALEKAVYEK